MNKHIDYKTSDKTRGDVVIAAGGDFLMEYLYREFSEHSPDNINVLTVGAAGNVDIVADLRSDVPRYPRRVDTVVYADGDATDGTQRAANLCRSLEHDTPGSLVYISTVAVYGREDGENHDETTPTEPCDDYGRRKLAVEQLLGDWCETQGVTLTVLRAAPIVGTGMGGGLRQLVNGIYRGTYRHIKGDESRCSVVHAVDVARAARIAASCGGVYNLTDGVNPTRHDLAEALAHRLDDKRIYSMSMARARKVAAAGDWIPFLPLDRDGLRRRLTTLTFDSSLIRGRLGLTPHSVTEYLRNHTYDENSL